MQIPGNLDLILSHKSNNLVVSVPPNATVFEAIQTMAEQNVGAVLVMRGDRLLGVLSERDYTRKVILKGRSSRQTMVNEIMSNSVITAPPHYSIDDALRLMTERRIRHLPVVDCGRVMGVISIGDLVKWVIAAQDVAISQLESYITCSIAG